MASVIGSVEWWRTKWRPIADVGLDLAWWGRQRVVALGLAGSVGVLLLAYAAWIVAVETPTKQATRVELQAELLKPQATPAPRLPRTSPLQELRDQLEREPRLTALMQDINTVSADTKVNLVEVSLGEPMYKTSPTIGRIEIKLSLHGSYPALKRCLATLLDHNPGLALEQVSLDRADASGDALDARAGLAWFFKRSP